MNKFILRSFVVALAVTFFFINQTTTSAHAQENLVEITQVQVNDVTMDVTQSGSKNVTKFDKFGRSGYLEVDQLGTENDYTGTQNGPELEVRVHQEGDRNIARTYQYGADSIVEVTSKGNDNTAIVSQGEAESTNLDIVLLQEGDNQNATIEQLGSDSNVNARMTSGSGNALTIFQDSKYSSYIDGEQKGSDNVMTINQGNDWSTNINIGYLQDGNNNTAEINQLGHDVYLTSKQVGNNNKATLTQDGESNVTLKVDAQGGDGNTITVKQGDTYAENLLTKISQDGSGNTADVFQLGYDGELILSQTGNENSAKLVQNGVNQTMRVTQNGDRHSATVTQDVPSRNNTAIILQTN